mgnify:FL=1|jgi:sialic acid synthase SpsE
MNNRFQELSAGEPYIIAEIGANHNGDMDLAKRMIKVAKQNGADAVKFQSWTPSSVASKIEYDQNQSYSDGDGGKKHFGSLKEMVEKYYLRENQHVELKDFCDSLEIDFCSTPFSSNEVEMLEKLDVPYYKIASMDIDNEQLLFEVAKTGKPVLLSTGMATLSEIETAIKYIETAGNNQIVILHCISIYPPEYSDINLNNIPMLKNAFDYPVGFSDHTIGTSIPLAAVALGCCIIEKHFTLDKDMPGWDHAISADPAELYEIAHESKNIYHAMGAGRRVVSRAEVEKKSKFRRSFVASRDLKKGEILTNNDIAGKRPGTGIPMSEINHVVGRELKKDVARDLLFTWEDFR